MTRFPKKTSSERSKLTPAIISLVIPIISGNMNLITFFGLMETVHSMIISVIAILLILARIAIFAIGRIPDPLPEGTHHFVFKNAWTIDFDTHALSEEIKITTS